jgi:Cft2 family RNA processing exonuclease
VIAVVARGGVHVPRPDVWLDPPSPRVFAFVSHAHSDHAGRHGGTVLTAATARLMRARLGPSPCEHVMDYGESREWNGARFTLLPAGHVLGSAQLFLEDERGSLLYTGDFKLRPGLSCEPAAWRTAGTLVMETTFGRPEFVFPPAEEVVAEIVDFCRVALADDAVPVLLAYSLGKAQEVLCAVAAAGLKPMLHDAAARMTRIYREFMPHIPDFADYDGSRVAGHALVCPPNVRRSRLVERIKNRRVAMVTGWALARGAVHRYRCDAVFPLSDHAGYDDLLRYVELVAPRRVFTVHGYATEFARDLRARGIEAWSLAGPDQLEFAGFGV